MILFFTFFYSGFVFNEVNLPHRRMNQRSPLGVSLDEPRITPEHQPLAAVQPEPESNIEKQRRHEKRKLLKKIGEQVHSLFQKIFRLSEIHRDNIYRKMLEVKDDYRDRLDSLRYEYPKRKRRVIPEYRLKEEELKRDLQEQLNLLKDSIEILPDEIKRYQDEQIKILAKKMEIFINKYYHDNGIITFRRNMGMFVDDIEYELKTRYAMRVRPMSSEDKHDIYKGLLEATETYTPADQDIYPTDVNSLFRSMLVWLLEKKDVKHPRYGPYSCSREFCDESLIYFCVHMRGAMDTLGAKRDNILAKMRVLGKL